jgi:hypothetical protein
VLYNRSRVYLGADIWRVRSISSKINPWSRRHIVRGTVQPISLEPFSLSANSRSRGGGCARQKEQTSFGDTVSMHPVFKLGEVNARLRVGRDEMRLLKLNVNSTPWAETIVQGFLLFVVSLHDAEVCHRCVAIVDMRPRPGSGCWKVGRIGFQQSRGQGQR